MTPVWAVPRGTEGVRIMVQGGIAHGMTAAECLAGSGLTEADLDDENAEIWAHQEFDVIRNLIAELGDRPGVGIEVGVHSTLGRAGLLGFLILASPNLRQGVELILPPLSLCTDNAALGAIAFAKLAAVETGALDMDVQAGLVRPGRELKS